MANSIVPLAYKPSLYCFTKMKMLFLDGQVPDHRWTQVLNANANEHGPLEEKHVEISKKLERLKIELSHHVGYAEGLLLLKQEVAQRSQMHIGWV